MNNHQEIPHQDNLPSERLTESIASERYANSYAYGANNDGQSNGLIELRKALATFRKWWWFIGLITTVLTALTVLWLSRATPIYSAQTILEIKQQERNIIGTSMTVEDVNADTEFMATQIELLRSRTLSENVINSLNLSSDPNFIDVNKPAIASLPRPARMALVLEAYNEKIRVRPVGRSRLIELSFEHSDPRKAAIIANTVAKTFINNALQRKYNVTAYARNFLEDRLATLRTSLQTAERDLVQYAADNDIIILGDQSNSSTSGSLGKTALINLDNELTKAKTERMRTQQAYTQAQEGSFALEILDNPAINKLNHNRIELNAEYIKKLAIYKPSFPEMIELKDRLDLFDKTIAEETSKIIDANRDGLEAEYKNAKAQEEALANRVDSLKKEVIGLRERSIEYTILKRRVDTERTQYNAVLQRLKEVSVSEDIGSNLVEIVDPAKPARFPFKPNKPRLLALALLLSTALGFAIAYVIELLDDRIKQPEDLKNKLGLIIMGVIPRIKDPNALTDALSDSQSSVAEAYAALRTNLQYSAIDGGPQIIQITSTQPGEGKSVTSLGLALRYASLGRPTILIDADMRRPTFKNNAQDSIGLSGLLTSRVNIPNHIDSTRYDNLDVITSGQQIPNPAEALASERFDEIIAFAREHYAYVIVDSPPVIGLADAPILGAKVDATLLVVESNELLTNNIKAALERLAVSGTHPLGGILTKYKASTGSYSYYRYSYGEGATSYSQKKPDATAKSSTKSKQKLNLG